LGRAPVNKYIGGKVPVTAHFTLQSTIDKDPAKMQAFVTALWRATQWIEVHNPSIVKSQTPLSSTVSEPTIALSSPTARPPELNNHSCPFTLRARRFGTEGPHQLHAWLTK
jgi:hypothetical protein